jgi:hypothetical protein
MMDQTHSLTSPSPTARSLQGCSMATSQPDLAQSDPLVADIRRAIQQDDLAALEQLLRQYDDAQYGSGGDANG